MIYHFREVGGTEILEEYFSVKDVPDIGEKIHRNGKFYERIFSTPDVDVGVKQKCRGYPYESYSLPDMGDFCEKSPKGLPIVRSQNHEREICAMTGRKRM